MKWHEILRTADAPAVAPHPPAAELALRVLAEVQRRRRQRTWVRTTSALVLFIAGGSAATWYGARLTRTAATEATANRPHAAMHGCKPDEVVDRTAELADLEAEAESRLNVARRLTTLLERDARLAHLRREAQQTSAALLARREGEYAAQTLYEHADRLYLALNRTESAAVTYAQIVRLFPESPWARLARARLNELAPPGAGGSL